MHYGIESIPEKYYFKAYSRHINQTGLIDNLFWIPSCIVYVRNKCTMLMCTEVNQVNCPSVLLQIRDRVNIPGENRTNLGKQLSLKKKSPLVWKKCGKLWKLRSKRAKSQNQWSTQKKKKKNSVDYSPWGEGCSLFLILYICDIWSF